jgi:hypothetical protein
MQKNLFDIQTQADTRGIIIGGKIDLLNTSLTTMSTALSSFSTMATGITMIFPQMINILTTIQATLLTTGMNTMAKFDTLIGQMANVGGDRLSQAIASASTATAKFSGNIAKNNFVTAAQSVKLNEKVTNLNNQTAQLIQVNKNLQALLDATLTNNGEGGEIRLMIDGRQVSKVIKSRQSNNTGSPTNDGTGDTGG